MWNKVLFQLLCACACCAVLIHSQSCVNKAEFFVYSYVKWTCENITNAFPTSKKFVNSLTCLECNIPILDENTGITNFRGVTFNLSNSHVAKIAESAFKGFKNSTRTFLFNNNEIEYIAPRVFSKFAGIEEINLKFNKLSTLETKVFEGTNLSTLDLSYNSLSRIDSIFDGLKVIELNLSSNSIKEIGPKTFDKVTFWSGRYNYGTSKLDLSNNLLDVVPLNTFKSSKKDNALKKLHLQNNVLKTVQNDLFLNLDFLEYLFLEDNRISQLYKNSFRGLSKLVALNLARNLITHLPLGVFVHLNQLLRLDLSQNRLGTLSLSTFGGLTSLGNLNVSHNDLRIIEEAHLLPMGKLNILDISNTRLRDFKLETIMEHHGLLHTLIINNNFWVCSRLVAMYKAMLRRRMFFISPSHNFDVPNLHGIACSRKELKSYDNLSFRDFLSIIAQDSSSDIYSFDPLQDADGTFPENTVAQDLRDISAMFIVVSVVVSVICAHCFIRFALAYLRSCKSIKTDKFTFLYSQRHSRVDLLDENATQSDRGCS